MRLFLVIVLVCAAWPAFAGNALAPFGFVRYCTAHPEECRAAPDAVVADLSLVRAVNRAVNREMVRREDVRDTWQRGPAGDCEDFALEKRFRLIRAGLPAGALRLAVGRLPSGQGHAVLLVMTPGGAVVLDNLTDAVLPVRRSAVRLEKMSSPDPRLWVRAE